MSEVMETPVTNCLSCKAPQSVEPATLCEHCLAKAIVLLKQGKTPAQIALGRDDIRAVLESWQESKEKSILPKATNKPKKAVSRETPESTLAIAEETKEPRSIAVLIPIDAVEANPYQPRKIFSEKEMRELVDSIKEKGVLQPILVRPNPDDETRYQLIAGERRWRASQEAGLVKIEAIVRQNIDNQVMAEMAIIENVQRHDMTAIEQAHAYKRLVAEFGLTADYIAQRIGLSRSVVSNRLRLLDLPPEVQDRIAAGQLSESHGRALVKYRKFPDFVSFYAGHIVEKQLTSKVVESGLHFCTEWPECNSFASDLAERGLLLILHSYDYQFVNDDDLLFEYPDDVFRGSIEEDEQHLFCLNIDLANMLHAQWEQRAEDERKEAQEAAKKTSDSDQNSPTSETVPAKKSALERYKAGEIRYRNDLNWDEYDTINSRDCPAACSSCECRVVLQSSADHDYKSTVCLDPKRHRALKAQESRIKNKARRENIAKLSNQVQTTVRRADDHALDAAALPILALAALKGINRESVKAVVKRLDLEFDCEKFAKYDTNCVERLDMLRLSSFPDVVRFTVEVLLYDELRKSADGNDKPTQAKWLLGVLGVDNGD